MADTVDNDCPIKVVRRDIQINELMCFVGCKSRIMPQPQIIKLCCDFYETPTIQTATDVLMQTISLPDGDKQKSHRRTRIAETNMMNIVSILTILFNDII